ncbi:hypothetical protein V2J09_017908 [Rumex salicifolius]
MESTYDFIISKAVVLGNALQKSKKPGKDDLFRVLVKQNSSSPLRCRQAIEGAEDLHGYVTTIVCPTACCSWSMHDILVVLHGSVLHGSAEKPHKD